jgi:phosphohistidine phosphatase
MNVTLVRHGTADERAHRDRERGLTLAGRQEVRALGEMLRGAIPMPELMLCSPFVRAVQTAELLATGLAYPGVLRIERGLCPDCAPPGIVELLVALGTGQSPAITDVVLVAHEPILSAVCHLLLGQPVPGLHRAEAVCLSWFPRAPGSAQLLWQGQGFPSPSET